MDPEVYLRHVTTRLYFSSRQDWTADLHQAVNFCNAENALHKVRERQLGQVEIVIRDGNSEKVLPVIEPLRKNTNESTA